MSDVIATQNQSETSNSPSDPKPERLKLLEKLRRFLNSLSPRSRNAGIVIIGLTVGVAVGALAYFVFPIALATFATLIGLSGPLAMLLPFALVALVSALYTMETLVFLERAFFKNNKDSLANQQFLMNLLRLSVLIAGVGAGIFMAATLPAVFTLLTIPGLTGSAGIALPLIFAGLISLALTAGISYLLYRASAMAESQAAWLQAQAKKPEQSKTKPENAGKVKTVGFGGPLPEPPKEKIRGEAKLEIERETKEPPTELKALLEQLEQAQQCFLPHQGRGKQVPDYKKGIQQFQALLASPELKNHPNMRAAIEWQVTLVKVSQNLPIGSEPGLKASQLILAHLESKLRESSFAFDEAGHFQNACQFVIQLAVSRDPALTAEAQGQLAAAGPGPLQEGYAELVKLISEGNKEAILAKLAEFKQTREAALRTPPLLQPALPRVPASSASPPPPTAQQMGASFGTKASEFDAKMREVLQHFDAKTSPTDDYKKAKQLLNDQVKPLLTEMNSIITSLGKAGEQKIYEQLVRRYAEMTARAALYQNIIKIETSPSLPDASKSKKPDQFLMGLAQHLEGFKTAVFSFYPECKERLNPGLILYIEYAKKHSSDSQRDKYQELEKAIEAGNIDRALNAIQALSPSYKQFLRQGQELQAMASPSPLPPAPPASPLPIYPPHPTTLAPPAVLEPTPSTQLTGAARVPVMYYPVDTVPSPSILPPNASPPAGSPARGKAS